VGLAATPLPSQNTPTSALLACERLHLWRGERHVLQGVSLSVNSGECLLVTGSNGAGKTSLLRTLAGLLEPEEGEVLWRGVSTRTSRDVFHADLAYLGHDAPLKGDLTGAENLRYSVGVRRAFSATELRGALERTRANPFADRPVRTLSAGQRRRVALAGLLLTSATAWLLDEPTTNLDTAGQALVADLIAQHLSSGGLAIAAIHHPIELPGHTVRKLELAAA
jgi:heme exporter protein A